MSTYKIYTKYFVLSSKDVTNVKIYGNIQEMRKRVR